MLSRVAERVYWMGRYMERVENIARIINVNAHLMLDMPDGQQAGWFSLMGIVGGEELAGTAFSKYQEGKKSGKQRKGVSVDSIQEQIVMKLLIADKSNPGSITSCLLNARENARTAREIIPSEAWILINDLYLYTKENASKSLGRTARSRFLHEIIDRSQQCTGLLAGTMSYNSAYEFIRLGRNLERADMTTRIVDVGAVNLMRIHQKKKKKVKETDEGMIDPFAGIMWMSVLQSLSAYQMYRQHVLDRINGEDVVHFLLKDNHFPRAVSSSLDILKSCLNTLPHNADALRVLAAAQRRIDQVKITALLEKDELHSFIDIIQADLASVHDEIVTAWFLPRVAVDADLATA